MFNLLENKTREFIENDKVYFGGTTNQYPGFFPPTNWKSWWLVGRIDSNLNLYWQKRIGGEFSGSPKWGCITRCCC